MNPTDAPETTLATPDGVRVERERVSTIDTLCRTFKLPDDFRSRLINGRAAIEGTDGARQQILEEVARRSEAQPHTNTRVDHYGDGQTFDNPQFLHERIAEGIASRFAPLKNAHEASQQFRGARLPEIARLVLEQRGERPRFWSDGEVIKRAMAYATTADFPSILGNVANKLLLHGYTSAPSGIKTVAYRSEAQDFRAKSMVRLGEGSGLQNVRRSRRGEAGQDRGKPSDLFARYRWSAPSA